MKIKRMLKEILTDPLHWVGWFVSSIIIIAAIVHFIHITFSITLFIVVFITLTLVDIIKHITKLQ